MDQAEMLDDVPGKMYERLFLSDVPGHEQCFVSQTVDQFAAGFLVYVDKSNTGAVGHESFHETSPDPVGSTSDNAGFSFHMHISSQLAPQTPE
jgi:hypothetical protein